MPIAEREHERLLEAFAAGEIGTWSWDATTGAVTWDERLERLYAMEPGTFAGTFEAWLEAIHPSDRARCLVQVRRALAHPGSYTLLHRMQWPDGSVRWIEGRGKVLVDEHGAPTGTIGVAFDVTSREERHTALVQQLANDRRLVHTVQQALLPSRFPRIPGISVAARYETAAGQAAIGGDWYTAVPLPGNRLGIGIGDVAGHGMTAIAAMAATRFSLRSVAFGEQNPARVMDHLSELVSVFMPDTMVTALYGIVDPSAATWSWALAGHPPPIVRTPDGVAKLREVRADPPLGIHRGYRLNIDAIEPGSMLVLCTDGLWERRDEPPDAGLARVVDAVASGPEDPGELCDMVMAELLPEGGGIDDAAILSVRVESQSLR